MSVVTTSPRGRAFMDAHEGNPLTCYLDPVRIPTIGRGFTMRSRSVRRELEKIGITKLVPGKTKLTSSQSEAIFAAVLRDEFEPAVVAKSPDARKQHEMDAAVSAIFNLGTGAMDWQWAKFWRAGKQKQAADYLATHYNTAGGKKLPGLVRRRKEEALLFEKGIYTGVGEGVPRSARETAPKQPDPVVKEAQAILSAKGFNPGARRKFFGIELFWELPVALGMAVIGESAAAYANLGQPASTGLIALLAYLGPRGVEALFHKWFDRRMAG